METLVVDINRKIRYFSIVFCQFYFLTTLERIYAHLFLRERKKKEFSFIFFERKEERKTRIIKNGVVD